jgi:TRAP-type C4-dicarboxylate transport system permease small subunit
MGMNSERTAQPVQTRNAFQNIENIVHIIITWLAYVGIAALLIMMMVTVADVFLRYAFRLPILGSMEITEGLMLMVSFLAIAFCTMEDGHVHMDIVTNLLPIKGRQLAELLGYILCLVYVAPMAYLYIPEALRMLNVNESSTVLGIPAFPFYFLISLATFLISLIVLANVIKTVARMVHK